MSVQVHFCRDLRVRTIEPRLNDAPNTHGRRPSVCRRERPLMSSFCLSQDTLRNRSPSLQRNGMKQIKNGVKVGPQPSAACTGSGSQTGVCGSIILVTEVFAVDSVDIGVVSCT